MSGEFELLEFEEEAWRGRGRGAGARPRGKPARGAAMARGAGRKRGPAASGFSYGAAAGRAQSAGGAAQGRRWPPPRRTPRAWLAGPYPDYGWWPYRVDVTEPGAAPPEPSPYDEPPGAQPEPPPDSDDGDDGVGAQGETPPALGASLARMPAALRPSYTRVGSLAQALASTQATGPGLYVIEFDANGRRRAYSGQSGDLRARLQRHALCARMMGIDPARITTYVALGLGDPAERRRREYSLHDTMFRHYPGVLTNQRRELEAELLGESTMHHGECGCARCRQAEGEFEVMAFGGAPLNETQEMELALELLAVGSEAELEQFLGKVFKGVWKGIKKVAKPLGGILKGIAKKALPFVGGALGSLIPIPGVGTALGSALGGALSKALEMEGVGEAEMELETARRFVRIAASAARAAGDGDGSPQAVRDAVLQALREHAPYFGRP